MARPDLDAQGRMIKPPLLEFNRYIELGMSCVVKLLIKKTREESQTIQFSLTSEQRREIAQSLLVCAEVIERERPTPPQ